MFYVVKETITRSDLAKKVGMTRTGPLEPREKLILQHPHRDCGRRGWSAASV